MCCHVCEEEMCDCVVCMCMCVYVRVCTCVFCPYSFI